MIETLCARYGWTPTQIREMPIDDVQSLLEIIAARAQLEEEAREKAERKYGFNR